MNKQIVFGFTGLIGSGKGAATEYLKERYGASTLSFSTMLRDVLDRFALPHTRDNLVKTSEAVRGAYGDDIMGKTIAADVVKNSAKLIVIEGFRRTADLIGLRTLPHFTLVEITANPKTRYERLLSRAQNPDERGKTYEEFLADEERSTEVTIPEVCREATERVNNDGTEKKLYQQLDELMKKYTN